VGLVRGSIPRPSAGISAPVLSLKTVFEMDILAIERRTRNQFLSKKMKKNKSETLK
jgi:hypothetical protein